MPRPYPPEFRQRALDLPSPGPERGGVRNRAPCHSSSRATPVNRGMIRARQGVFWFDVRR